MRRMSLFLLLFVISAPWRDAPDHERRSITPTGWIISCFTFH